MTQRPFVAIAAQGVPSAWLGCEACYGAGRLVGHWYPVTEIGDVTMADLHGRPTAHEEAVCMDTDGLPTTGEPSQETAARWGEIYEEVGPEQWPALCAWVHSGSYVAEGDTDYPAIGDFEERYAGEWDSFDEYAQDLADDIGLLRDVPEEVERYFDWASWTRDLRFDYSVEDAPGGGVFVFRDL